MLRNEPCQEELPIVVLHPSEWNKRVVIWIHESGKAGLFGAEGQPTAEVMLLLKSGCAVVGADLVYQGEFLADGKPLEQARRVDNPREFAGYTLGYNAALLAQRVHDVLTLISFCRTYADEQPQVDLLGFGTAGVWVAAARAQAGEAVARAAIDTAGFRFASIESLTDLNFLPGAVKYGDVPGLLALGAPGRNLAGRRRADAAWPGQRRLHGRRGRRQATNFRGPRRATPGRSHQVARAALADC